MNNLNHVWEGLEARKYTWRHSSPMVADVDLPVFYRSWWLRSVQGQCMTLQFWRTWTYPTGGEGSSRTTPGIRVYDIGHCPSLCPHDGSPQQSKYLQLQFTDCGCYFSYQLFSHLCQHQLSSLSLGCLPSLLCRGLFRLRLRLRRSEFSRYSCRSFQWFVLHLGFIPFGISFSPSLGYNGDSGGT